MERLRPVKKRQTLIYQHQQSNLTWLKVSMLPWIFPFDSKMGISLWSIKYNQRLGLSLRFHIQPSVQVVFLFCALLGLIKWKVVLTVGRGATVALIFFDRQLKGQKWLLMKLVPWLKDNYRCRWRQTGIFSSENSTICPSALK